MRNFVAKNYPTQEELKRLLDYNLLTGEFRWKASGFRRKEDATRMGGKIAGCKNKAGYIFIRLNRSLFLAHRLAFIYMLGYVPEFVDHTDRVRTNNSWINLRVATRQVNNVNVTTTSNTGELNIYWVESKNHFLCSMMRDGKSKSKTFSSIEEAKQWRDNNRRDNNEKHW